MKEDKKSRDRLPQQWQTGVEMANSVSQKRDNMNNPFVMLKPAIRAAVSFAWDMITENLRCICGYPKKCEPEELLSSLR